MKPLRPSLVFVSFALCVGFLILRAADSKPASLDEHYALPKVEVKSNAICSYGIGVAANLDKETQIITHLYIETVAPGSIAEELGLLPGDEILSLNGRKVTSLKGGMKRGSDLFELLVDQPAGRAINLKVAVRTVKNVTLNTWP